MDDRKYLSNAWEILTGSSNIFKQGLEIFMSSNQKFWSIQIDANSVEFGTRNIFSFIILIIFIDFIQQIADALEKVCN